MQSLQRPLTKKEQKKFTELLKSDELFDRMLERAVRGRRGPGRRVKKSS